VLPAVKLGQSDYFDKDGKTWKYFLLALTLIGMLSKEDVRDTKAYSNNDQKHKK
jgi:hypothetical protein